MLKRRPELHFVTILISIDKIKRHVKNVPYKQFIENETIFGFVVRNLQEIGEAVKQLMDTYDLVERFPEEGDWRKIVDFRNVVVHKYFGTEPEIIFAVANNEVLILESQMFNVFQKMDDKTYLWQAIEMTIPIYEKINRVETVNYLKGALQRLG